MIDRPWMDALEQKFATLRKWQHVAPGTPHLPALRAAEVFAWTDMPTTAILRASRSISDREILTMDLLPCPIGWWYFPSFGQTRQPAAVLFESHTAASEQLLLGELIMISAWAPQPDGLEVATFVPWQTGTALNDALDKAVQVHRLAMDDIKAIPGSSDSQAMGMLMRLFLAACVWLQQRILITSSGPVERHRRKQLARDYHAPLPNDVKIIELRRRESSRRSEGSGELVEWSCQWVVSGHWTHQVYGPGHSERRLQYVLPYVKGPSDKPLKVPGQTVYVVRR